MSSRFRFLNVLPIVLKVVILGLTAVSCSSLNEERIFLDVLSGKNIERPLALVVRSSMEGSEKAESLTIDPVKSIEYSINNLTGKHDLFQTMKRQHVQAVQICADWLTSNSTGVANSLEIMYRASKLRGRINSQVWTDCILKTTVSSPEMQGMHKPALIQVIPEQFVPRQFVEWEFQESEPKKIDRPSVSNVNRPIEPTNVNRQNEPTNSVNRQNEPTNAKPEAARPARRCRVLDETFSESNGIENRLWYFREDLMVNAQHYYWHLEYPFAGQVHDRQGELFYYFHQSILARYNSERLSNNLPLAIAISVERNILEEGYTTYLEGSWVSRTPNQAIRFDNILPYVQNLRSSIDTMSLIHNNGQPTPLNGRNGIDILGKVIVGSDEFYHRYTYIHTEGHNLISGQHGVMVSFSTSMRDPAFYRWHVFINDLLERHKSTLPEYLPTGGDFALVWAGVQVTSIEATSDGTPRNNLKTFWSEREFDISMGLDFRRLSSPSHICVKHLDHQPFEFKINVMSDRAQRATVRIFLAPRYNLDGRRFSMEEQRKLFFVLDGFSTNLNSGNNEIRRRSSSSTLTRPWSKTFEELQSGRGASIPECGCGWPEHLLIPKGRTEGMTFDLFVMVTNGVDDSNGSLGEQSGRCSQPYLYCGIRGQAYPDRKPMGFPFDRRSPYLSTEGRRVDNLDEFVGLIANSKTVQVVITHSNKVMSGFK